MLTRLFKPLFDLKAPFRSGVLWLIWGWLILLVLLPNLLVIGVSFLERDPQDFIRFSVSLDNYQRLFDPLYLGVFSRSLYMAVMATVLCLAIGYPFAWGVSRVAPRWRPLLMFLLIVPFWTNSLVRTYAIKVLLAGNGLINSFLIDIGLISQPLQLLYTEGAVIIGLIYVLLPFMILPLYSVFEQLREDLLAASADLGASRWRTFRHVVIPMTMPGVIAGCLLVLLPAMGMFYIADVLGGSRVLLVGNVIKSQFLDARDWPFGAAASVMLTVAMALLLLAYWQSVRRVRQQVAL